MILITGGLGFVGSHMALHMLQQGKGVVLVDNLVNSHAMTLDRLQQIAGQYLPFAQLDIRNTPALNKFVEQYPIDAVVHCAGFKSLQESAVRPIEYYNNNLNALMSLVRVMQRVGCRRLVHLSSAMVYGQSSLALDEQTPLHYQAVNPYIQTQQMMERILNDVAASDPDWEIRVLRVANVAGAFEQGFWGEYIPKLPKNIMGLLMQVANQEREYIELYQQANTSDQTVERSFVHILDVCQAIEKAIFWKSQPNISAEVFNIAHSNTLSMASLIQQVKQITQRQISTIESSLLFAPFDQVGLTTQKAQQLLGWQAERSLEQMIEDQWRFYHSR
ncbi:SDR family NAD(P)-dependent oxidoreductase [Acinetobacter sp. MD2]|uniref:SDR family NAD(P)-dependent oxidoreductase n=1 Tax=Acinetobacter sp. MD2 TaxID=2600066 RepID=UPI002D1F10BA|nr:SDR family NAD(P)-dependent oxidoreductase [Acinetobacter sp. MD2]MEB3766584.1 SDR family NAD(P)-dependent oxidoreductase [Acinetobacter sp. MD2]